MSAVATPAGMSEGPPGMVYSRADMTWLTPEEAARRQEARVAQAARRRSHNRFPCPYYAPDVAEHTVGVGPDKRLIGSRRDQRDFCERNGVAPEEAYAVGTGPHWSTLRETEDREIRELVEMQQQMSPEQIEPLRPDVADDAGVIDDSDAPVAVGAGEMIQP